MDMAYLVTKAKDVVGVEAIEIALQEFSQEHPYLNIKMAGTKDGYTRFEGDKIVLLKGDYFALDDTKIAGRVDAIWDRGSMVAIPLEMREKYVEVIGKLIAPGGRIMLVSLERRGEEEAMKRGPPFSLTEEVVRGLFESQDWVESVTMVQQTDQLETHTQERERYEGLDQLLETAFLIQARMD
jgi:thiopurine S-methyltransferase